ncbi:hypothetical protein SISSUDRAFT_980784 [Sistotremastrum suecicum HHB10207 ss-3]|uniref:NAD(P)-binding protein n=1 Tax=Sistotremastrum suecicum HHB10207 ss-3 TaxID=1314776 RepID=A0A166GTT0_9AGAM|nr:hypothetical protein SISSUDRAFT_980784 [Sistotremastrum suecicum HHB10207 ss-3]
MSSKPNVLIFGGVNTYSRHLAAYLVPESGESLVQNLRIVDKFSVYPPTTYLGAVFPRILKKPNVEYKQANLTVPATVSSVFDPPPNQEPYSYIFDFTGEIRYDRPDLVQVGQTLLVSRLIAQEAANRKVKAYVRIQLPWYDSPDKGLRDEKDHQKTNGVIGTWWHETLRSLAAIKDLNLVILRIGIGYGPYLNISQITTAVVIGRVYKFLEQEMKFLWSPNSPVHTVHLDDIARAAWSCATWIAPLGREEANKIAGEQIWFANDKSKLKGIDGVIDPSLTPIAPFFNLVDDSELTQQSLGTAIGEVFGIKTGFHGFVQATMAKVFSDLVEDVNEEHVAAWNQILMASNPQIPNTPLSAYMDSHMFSKPGVAYSNAKIKRILGFTLLHPRFTPDEIRAVIDAFKEEGTWPNA